MSIAHDHLRIMKDLDANAAGFLNGSLDPLSYDGQMDTPQEIARMLADLVPAGVARVRCRLWQCRRNKTLCGFSPD